MLVKAVAMVFCWAQQMWLSDWRLRVSVTPDSHMHGRASITALTHWPFIQMINDKCFHIEVHGVLVCPGQHTDL